ncbi:MAG: methionine--tRNA ligase subunit beta [Bacteroidales bacterium]|nr:methionine--tRNA ligase subunit beta [Candidatus Cryptobacteroides faecihippi]
MLDVCICAGVDHRKGEQETVNTYKEGECAALHTVSAPTGADIKAMTSSCPGIGKCVCLSWDKLGATDILPEGHAIGTAELLFAKIEDEAIDAQLQRLATIKAEREAAAAAAAAEEAAKKIEPQKDPVTFDDFGRMDIRTATVLAAERVPKTDKLLKLSIDTGIDQRTIVSGIAEYYTPEEMVGKQICILANLEPRTIRGIESKGMILMARQGDGKMRFITPAEALVNGAVIG